MWHIDIIFRRGSSRKIWGAWPPVMASAGARAYQGGPGALPPAGVQGAEPPVEVRGGSPLKLTTF